MIDFATLQGLNIPEGAVVQIEDAQGRVLWALPVASGSVVLEVKKITATTYAGSTSYANEKFILLDIYPKTNGTVTVTYGGLTKTITDTSGAASPNAKQVYFGTFNGVPDAVETPESGTLTIDGDYSKFAVGTYADSSKASAQAYCGCVTAITEFGSIKEIADCAFYKCTDITSVSIPNGVTRIGMDAFYGCTGMKNITIPSSVTIIDGFAFYDCRGLTSLIIPNSVVAIATYAFALCGGLVSVILSNNLELLNDNLFQICTSLESITIPNAVKQIGASAFSGCSSLNSVTFENTSGWYISGAGDAGEDITVDVTDPANNAAMLTNTYKSNYWKRT